MTVYVSCDVFSRPDAGKWSRHPMNVVWADSRAELETALGGAGLQAELVMFQDIPAASVLISKGAQLEKGGAARRELINCPIESISGLVVPYVKSAPAPKKGKATRPTTVASAALTREDIDDLKRAAYDLKSLLGEVLYELRTKR